LTEHVDFCRIFSLDLLGMCGRVLSIELGEQTEFTNTFLTFTFS
jgi:hypothetical protein